MKLGILTAIWGRPRLTELVLDYYGGNTDAYYLHAVGSPDDPYIQDRNEAFFVDPKKDWWVFSYADNDPLSDKWIDGAQYLKHCDAVMIVGSDDLVTPEYIEACRYLIEGGAEFIHLSGCYFYDAISGRMIWGNPLRLGLGRCLSRSLLERLDWQPWEAGLSQGLDGSMMKRIEEVGARTVRLKDERKHRLVGLDIKTDQNMWSFDHIRDEVISTDIDDPASVLREYFPSVADQLINWNAEAKDV